MVTAVFPGSFDPPTYGHLNVIERASALFDTIDVLVSINPGKNSLFSAEERVSLLKELTKNFKNVQVHSCDTLVVEYARKIGAKALLRGIRNANDFSYEFDLALVNRSLTTGWRQYSFRQSLNSFLSAQAPLRNWLDTAATLERWFRLSCKKRLRKN